MVPVSFRHRRPKRQEIAGSFDTFTPKMEFAVLITTPGLVHIFEEIINHMDTKSLSVCPLVCKAWWRVIRNHPKWWKYVIRKIRIKKALIHPDFRGVMESVEAKNDIKNLSLVLQRFCEDKQVWSGELNMRDAGFFNLVFRDLQRLKYFWPHLPNKNPRFINDEYSALHILASLGDNETFQLIAENVDNVNPNYNKKNTTLKTPLHCGNHTHCALDIAKQYNHFRIVQIIEDKLDPDNILKAISELFK